MTIKLPNGDEYRLIQSDKNRVQCAICDRIGEIEDFWNLLSPTGNFYSVCSQCVYRMAFPHANHDNI